MHVKRMCRRIDALEDDMKGAQSRYTFFQEARAFLEVMACVLCACMYMCMFEYVHVKACVFSSYVSAFVCVSMCTHMRCDCVC